jgi:hypothetical protein
MTEKGRGIWWRHEGNEGTGISINDSVYNDIYNGRLSGHNTLNIYNDMVKNGTMDLNPAYMEVTEKWWHEGLSALGLEEIADKLAGTDKYITYDQYKANNFIQNMPGVDERSPLTRDLVVTTFFMAKGDISANPHRGMDLRAQQNDVYPIFANTLTKANTFTNDTDFDSIQGYHVDMSTEVSYLFKGQPRKDTVVQRMLHMESIAVENGAAVSIETLLGKSGKTGNWDGRPYDYHLHTDIYAGNTGSPWLNYLSGQAQQKLGDSYKISPAYAYNNNIYYDPMIFLHKYGYGVASGAGTYNRDTVK